MQYLKNHISKTMLATKIVQLTDQSLDSFKHWGCKIFCVKLPCFCKINIPVTRCASYELYS